jgi:hypothetical protein
MGLYQIKRFLHSKRNNNVKRQSTEWEKIFARQSPDKELYPEYTEFKKSKNK